MRHNSQSSLEWSIPRRGLPAWSAKWAAALKCWMLVLAGILAVATPGRGAEDETLEYKVKAGFLYQFARFVEWPSSVTPATNSPIVVGLLAGDPAASIVQEQLQDAISNGHPMIVKLLSDTDTVTNCHMLFLSRAQKDRIDQVLVHSTGKPILTVGELDRFALDGGVINFVRKNETFRFQVNLQAAEKAGLKISAKLASLATVVKPGR